MKYVLASFALVAVVACDKTPVPAPVASPTPDPYVVAKPTPAPIPPLAFKPGAACEVRLREAADHRDPRSTLVNGSFVSCDDQWLVLAGRGNQRTWIPRDRIHLVHEDYGTISAK